MTRERSRTIAASAAGGARVMGALDAREVFHAAHAERSRFRLELGRSLRMHRRLALVIAIIGVAVTAAYLWKYWPVYSAQAIVYIQPAPAAESDSEHRPYEYDPATYDSYLQQQMLSMKRPDVLKSAIGKMQNFQRNGESDEEAADRLSRALDIERQGNSFQVALKAQAGNAQFAADMANAVAQSYIESTSNERRSEDAQRISILRAEADRVKKELDDDRAKQVSMQGAGVAAASSTGNAIGGSELAGEIIRLQMEYDALVSQIQDLTFQDAAPETAHIATEAVAPGQPILDGVVRVAAIMLAAYMLLAIFLALAAHQLDPRIYVASDVERTIGFMPIAELPDLGEVSAAVFEEQLSKLSVTIDFALKKLDLKKCVFTGTGPGTGVTTISSHVRAAMEGINRPAILVDAEGNRALPEMAAASESEPGSALPLIHVLQLTEEAQDDISILADAAPLTISAETEYLVRNVDFVVVVVESGVTTRAELDATTRALQRLDVSAVGIVLNRVTLARADAEFKDALLAMEGHVRTRSRKVIEEPLRKREAEVRVEQQERVAAAAAQEETVAPPVSEQIAEQEKPADEAAAERGGETFSGALSDAMAAAAAEHYRRIDPVRREPAEEPSSLSAMQAEKERTLPWWLADPLIDPHGSAQAQEALAHEPKADEQTTVPIDKGSRLSDLRGLFAERNALSGVRVRMNVSANRPAPVQKEPARSFASATEPSGTVHEREQIKISPAPLRRETPEVVNTVPEFLPPRRSAARKRAEDAASRRERRETWDDLAVLPTWRGQYRRKE